MSCAGFDFGNANCLVAIARRGGIDVCTNEVSNRTTPCLVAFNGESRSIGESAVSSVIQNYKNTITEVKRILGRPFKDEQVQRQLKRSFYEMVEDEQGRTAMRVQYGPNGEKQILSPEAIVAMILTNLGESAAAEYGSAVKDCVISIPAYFTDAQRRAMKNAAKIAGFSVLRLFHEHAAAALSYGLYRTADLPEENPFKVAIVDVGHSATTCSIVGFLKTKLTVYSVAFDSDLGGRNFDDVLLEHFITQFDKKYKLDIRSSPRAFLRLRTACEKLKKVLSANSEAPLNVECLMNDVDVSGYMKRSEFEEMIANLIKRICLTCQRALEGANLSCEDINSVEIVGGSTRIPAVQNALEQFFGRTVMKTLNADETIGRGCALEGAIISPSFRVKPYSVEDVMPYPISVFKRCGSSEESIKLFTRFNPIPSLKQLTFTVPYEPVELVGYYEDAGQPVKVGQSEIVRFIVDAPKKTKDKDTSKLRVRLKLSSDGILTMYSAYVLDEVEEEKTEDRKPAAVENTAQIEKQDQMDVEGEQPKTTVDQGSTSANMEGQNGAETNATDNTGTVNSTEDSHVEETQDSNKVEANSASPETKQSVLQTKKVKTKQVEIKYSEVPSVITFNEREVESARAAELEMRARDQYLRDRSDALNALEAYVYDIRNNLSDYGGPLKDFIQAEGREQLLGELGNLEDWIYSDEAANASKSVFTEKLTQIKSKGDVIVRRKSEWEIRPEAIAELQRVIETFRIQARSDANEFDHITEEERKKVLDCVKEAEEWLSKQLPIMEKLQKYENCPITVNEIREKAKSVQNFCQSVMNRPKPAPPKNERVPQTSNNQEANTEKMDMDATGTETDAKETGENMNENGQVDGTSTSDAMETESNKA
eukprot:jgi/Galph1/1128/GphlegSOOS_G5839.1